MIQDKIRKNVNAFNSNNVLLTFATYSSSHFCDKQMLKKDVECLKETKNIIDVWRNLQWITKVTPFVILLIILLVFLTQEYYIEIISNSDVAQRFVDSSVNFHLNQNTSLIYNFKFDTRNIVK